MHQTNTLKDKLRLFIKILWPILIVQISFNLMTLLDTMMSGQVGTVDLAGVAIGSSLWMAVSIGLSGILVALSPIIGQLVASNQRDAIGQHVTHGFYMAIIISAVVVTAGIIGLDDLLAVMKLDAEVHRIAKHYLIGLSMGIVPFFVSNVLRFFFDAQGHTRITMIVLVIAVPLNALLNYLLIFGKLGFPRLGGVGSGYATAITYWAIMLVSIGMTFWIRSMRSYRLFLHWPLPSWRVWKEQLAIGVPMGLTMFFEASIFSIVTLLMGNMFSTEVVAAHQAAINFTSLIFMLPLSTSMALTILVAYEIGAGRYLDARQYSRCGIVIAMGLMFTFALLMFLLRAPIASLYTKEAAVIGLIVHFFLYAVFFQLTDSAQAALLGILRGYKDARIPFFIAFVSYWLVGIPAGYMLAAYSSLGPFGLWVGITFGLTCACIGFSLRLRQVSRATRLLPDYDAATST